VIPSTLEARLIWSDGAGTWANVFHYRYTTPPTFGTAFADTVFTNMKSAATAAGILANLSDLTIMERVEIKDLNSAHLPSWPSSGAPQGGAGIGAAMPLNTSIEITLRSANSGKGFIGRKYFAGLDDVVRADARHFTSAAGGTFRTFVDTLRTNPPSGCTLAIGRRALLAGADSHGNPLPARPADSLTVVRVDLTDFRFDSQRRRLGRS
jgi:hypothetical protein